MSVMPRARALVASTHMVRRKRSRASTSSLSARVLPWPNAFRVASPWIEIEELGGEGGVGSLPVLRVPDVELVPQAGGEQRHQRKAQHDQRDRQVDEGHDSEDQHGREQGDQELRQELAEVGFELLDAVDHGKRERARALAADRARPQRGDAVVERAPERLLHPRRRLVRHHGAPMLGDAAQHHDQGDQQHGGHELDQRAAGEDLADQPAQQAEAGDAQPDG